MNGYLLSIIGTVLFSACIVAIVPEGKMSGTVKGVAKMVCLLAIIAPIPQYMKKQENNGNVQISQEKLSSTGIQMDVQFIQYYSEMRIRETENALEEEIFEMFSCTAIVSLVAEDIDAQTGIDEIKIAYVQVDVQTGETLETKKEQIRNYLTELCGCEVLIE